MLSEKKLNLPINTMAHYLYFTLFIVVIITFYAVSSFLYKNFYLVVTQSEIIIILKKDVAVETFDLNKFNAIMDKIQQKTTKRAISETGNPFN